MSDFKRGLKSGIPIGLGYLSVSFTFGIIAVGYGLHWWQAVLISMLTVTSAGQFAGIGTMMLPGQYLEMLISQITINVRYSFMGVSLSQKTSPRFKRMYRWILGFMMTDEIFGVASQEKEVTPRFFAGLSVIPYVGWSLGTLVGAILGNILPEAILVAMNLAIYGMFVAIVVPVMRKNRAVVVAVAFAIAFSCAFRYAPILKEVSSGLAVSICAILAAIICAVLFPRKGDEDE